MKKIVFFALAALAFVACNKNTALENGSVVKSEKAIIKVGLGSATKATTTVADTEDEAKVSSIQIFVFNEFGDVDGYKVATTDEVAALTVEVAATVGTRDIYAFVNAPDLKSFTRKADLLAAEHEFTANSALDKFVMQGKLESQSVTASFSATINVDRYASRIKLHKVTRNFSNPALAALDFSITRVYLTNVNDKAKYSFALPATYKWLSARFANSGAIATGNTFVYNKLASAATVANEAAYETAHSLYAYPNGNDAVVKDEEAVVADQTILIVECKIDGKFYTYPVPVGAVGSNKSYEIKNLILTRLGNLSNGDDKVDEGEDTPIQATAATFEIVVNDWEEVLLGTDGNFTI